MKTLILIFSFFLSLSLFAENKVLLKTNKGDICIELNEKKAPETVKNFKMYVKEGFYNGTIFHRVIGNFMIQGGGFDTKMKKKPTKAPIKNEANNGLGNFNGTIAMARTSDPNSATAQFFINVKDNNFLNYSSPTPQGYGYAVFGRVVRGMTTVNRIKKVKVGNRGAYQNVPSENVIIESATFSCPKS